MKLHYSTMQFSCQSVLSAFWLVQCDSSLQRGHPAEVVWTVTEMEAILGILFREKKKRENEKSLPALAAASGPA